MKQEQIERINELARKSKTTGLTPEEKEEQKKLRAEYIASVRMNLRTQLDNINIQEKDGSIVNLGEKYGKKKKTDPHLLSRFLREIIQYYRRDYTIRSMTLIRHAEIFRSEGFVPMKEWTQYVTMEYSKNR